MGDTFFALKFDKEGMREAAYNDKGINESLTQTLMEQNRKFQMMIQRYERMMVRKARRR